MECNTRDGEGCDREDAASNPSRTPVLADMIRARHSRRGVLRAGLAAALGAGFAALAPAPGLGAARTASRFRFPEVGRGAEGTHRVAAGHDARVLIRWGDPVLPGARPFDPHNQTAAAQARQFGYNNDFVGYLALSRGAGAARHGLLCVNHEYTSRAVMFPRALRQATGAAARQRALIEMAAHGGTVIEVVREKGRWRTVPGGPFSRRISAGTTVVALTGPAAGHRRLATSADRSARRVVGTLANCAGGITPWGTWLMAEENFNGYFQGARGGHPEAAKLERLGIPRARHDWAAVDARFDIGREPFEVNRFGWVVEVDPYHPASLPAKRTALGRFKHEGATPVLNGDGRVVVYSGDDQAFEYLYKFVSRDAYDPADRAHNMRLLDDGTLYAARFDADGGVTWLALVHGQGPLVAARGFASQADVLIDARLAADALGATPLDRPEDVEPDPVTGRVYVMLTNNTGRRPGREDAVNRRAPNPWGQIVEITPAGGDHAAQRGAWELLVMCGDPAQPGVGAAWNPATSADGWLANPDNAAFDGQGRLWVASDQGGAWQAISGGADGLWGLETVGPLRGTGRMFFRAPVGAEVTGPWFAPGDGTLFLAVQHPATNGATAYPGFARASTFEDPATRWPDFSDAMPPRPSVLAITRTDGGVVGG